MARENIDKESLYKEASPDVYLVLVDIIHESLSEPIRGC